MDPHLISALFRGAQENPPWKSFLALLRDCTRADHCVLNFHPPGRPFQDGMISLSGETPVSRLEEAYLRHFAATDVLPGHHMPEGKPFSLDEAYAILADDDRDRIKEFLRHHDVSAVLQMRVREESGLDAFLSISRQSGAFSEADKGLLREVAPVLRGVFQLYAASERDRFVASLTAEAIQQLHFGWLTLDAKGQILDCDELGGTILSRSGVLSRSRTGRLAVKPFALGREIAATLREMASEPQRRPRAFTLRREPWLDMLLVANRRKTLSVQSKVVAVAYVHADNSRASDRHEQLGELFGLSPREAKLALAISRGMTLAEAAEHHGWTETTARTYSRLIYAKTGARGQADLVRIILRSVVSIVPPIE